MFNVSTLRGGCAVFAAAALFSGCSVVPQKTQMRDPAFMPARPMIQQAPREVTGSIYNSHNNRFLFEDIRARRVGDLLTVILEEETAANKSASTSSNKKSDIEIKAPSLFGGGVTANGRPILQSELNSKIDFAGGGDSAQSNSLEGNITVTVAEVLPNGFMVVRGEKLMTLNQGSEVVRISGIVRPVDISPANTIKSHQIANAEITYGGKGLIADSNNAGIITRFFNSRYWPF